MHLQQKPERMIRKKAASGQFQSHSHGPNKIFCAHSYREIMKKNERNKKKLQNGEGVACMYIETDSGEWIKEQQQVNWLILMLKKERRRALQAEEDEEDEKKC
jgi:hypothetical protein